MGVSFLNPIYYLAIIPVAVIVAMSARVQFSEVPWFRLLKCFHSETYWKKYIWMLLAWVLLSELVVLLVLLGFNAVPQFRELSSSPELDSIHILLPSMVILASYSLYFLIFWRSTAIARRIRGRTILDPDELDVLGPTDKKTSNSREEGSTSAQGNGKKKWLGNLQELSFAALVTAVVVFDLLPRVFAMVYVYFCRQTGLIIRSCTNLLIIKFGPDTLIGFAKWAQSPDFHDEGVATKIDAFLQGTRSDLEKANLISTILIRSWTFEKAETEIDRFVEDRSSRPCKGADRRHGKTRETLIKGVAFRFRGNGLKGKALITDSTRTCDGIFFATDIPLHEGDRIRIRFSRTRGWFRRRPEMELTVKNSTAKSFRGRVQGGFGGPIGQPDHQQNVRKRISHDLPQPSPKWQQIAAWCGNGNKVTPFVTVPGNDFRVHWKTQPGGESDGNFDLLIVRDDGIRAAKENVMGAGSDTTYGNGPGRFRLDINSSQEYEIRFESKH